MTTQQSPGVELIEQDLTYSPTSADVSSAAFVGPFTWGPALDPTLISLETTLVTRFGKPNLENNVSWLTASSFLAYSSALWVTRVVSDDDLNACALDLIVSYSDGTTSAQVGSNLTITSGVLSVTANGDYTFTGATGFTGLVSGLTYTLTSGATGSIPNITIATGGEVVTGSILLESYEAIQVRSTTHYDESFSLGEATTSGPFCARYVGAKGNSLLISIADSASYDTWEYKNQFDSIPGTSNYALARGGSNDEFHIIVIDRDGEFTGTAGTVLERYPFVSKGIDCKDDNGETSYYKTVIYNSSSYIHSLSDLPATNIGTSVVNKAFGNLYSGVARDIPLVGGVDNFSNITDSDYEFGWDTFSSSDEVDVSIGISGPRSSTVKQYIIDNIAEARGNLVVHFSPNLSDVRGDDKAEKCVTYKGTINRSSSYYFMNSNWKLMYDKYNEINVWVPLDGDTAGLSAAVDYPWYSPAGLNRGNIKNSVRLAWNPNKDERDLMYRSSINSIISITGVGPVLYGDKTGLTRASAFDRLNVRMLFIYLKKIFSRDSRYTLFELNDEFTRAQFVNMITPTLRDVKGLRGIYDFYVQCDENNNTSDVIDANELVASIAIKPAKSINYITLYLNAVNTGVTFSESSTSVAA